MGQLLLSMTRVRRLLTAVGLCALFAVLSSTNVYAADTTVPNVVGMTESEANVAITDANLVLGTVTYQYSDTVPAGLVISQSPAGGTEVPQGSTVDLVVSLGPSSIVPDVVGMAEPNAAAAITDANLTVGTVDYQYNDTVAAGLVISQDPAGGTEVPQGSAVDLVVSLGPSSIVPDVVGMAEPNAAAAITDANLTVGTVDYQYSDTVPAGLVISQSPAGGTEVPQGSAVDLVVSSGPSSIVPDVVGMAEPNAAAAITDANLTVGTVNYQYSDTVAAGLVISQNPDGGTEVQQGSAVDLVVSSGPSSIVPDVVGMAEPNAAAAITDANLTVGTVDYQYSDTVAAGLVISQSPAGGTEVPQGSAVDLVVSLGPSSIVPDVVGMTEPNAAAAITDANLTVGTVTYQYSDTVPAGLVISQSPAGGTEVPQGSAVDLVVSSGPSSIVPDVVGMAEPNAAAAITDANLTVGTVDYQYSDTVAAGLVISQSPVGGVEVAEGSAVNLVVSLGKSTTVPDIVGLTQADANSAIIAAGLIVGTISYQYDNTVPSGIVISQNPASGTEAGLGSSVDFVVSSGKPVVPDVVGMSRNEAIAMIEAVDSLTAAATYQHHNTVPAGTVISQNPAGGSVVEVGATVNIVVSLGRPVVPGVVGLSEAEAVAAIESVDGLTASVSYEYSNTIPADTVMSQEPAGGTSVDVGTTVYIVVSLGRPVVPDVVGLPEATAVAAIEAIDNLLAAPMYRYDNNVPFGYVISQYPVGGIEVDTGTAVNITISLGRPVVPGVVGQPEATAIAAIEAVDNLTVANISYEYHNTVEAGLVISQDPAGGMEVPIGSTVDLVVSLGRPIAPDVVGMSEADATTAITAVDSLQVGSVVYIHSDTVPDGNVISQDPVGGTAVPIGTSIDLVVSLGPSVVPEVVGMNEPNAYQAIAAADLAIGDVNYVISDTVAAGLVISQEPNSGIIVPVGTDVNMVIAGVISPNTVGLTEADANTAIFASGLGLGEVRYDYNDTIPAGVVISQNPQAGAIVSAYASVDLVVSSGKPTVPDVVGMTEADANTTLAGFTLAIGTIVREYNDTVPEGIVTGQAPAAGTTVFVGSAVDLVVSLGKPVVPNVVGMTQTDATSAITAVDSLTVGIVTSQYSNTVPAGYVMSQNPAAGVRVPIGSSVDLVVSLGKPVVPDVEGMPEAAAREAITSVDNLQVGTITQAYHDTIPVGSVVSQDPAAGVRVPIGSSVNLVISLGRPVVPDVVAMPQSAAKTLITSNSLTVGAVSFEYSDVIPGNYIVSQCPVGGTVVFVGTAVDIVISYGKPFVPNVVGLTEAEAGELLGRFTLVVGNVTYAYHDTVSAGLVISQNPAAGTTVTVGSTVDLVVSLGKPTVPDVVGQTEADANSILASMTLNVGTVIYEYNDVIPKDVVISQSPVAGTTVWVGSSVDLVVSLGQPIVPDIVGMTQSDANSAIVAVDSLQIGTISYEYHDSVPRGVVISQNPVGGTAVPIGSSIDYSVSLGRPVVPDVVGMKQVDANKVLADASLVIGTITYQYDPNIPEGIVISQSPAPGTVVSVGSTVDLVVSLAVVPNVVGLSKTDAYFLLEEVELVIGKSSYLYSDTIPAATVISQDPPPGTRLPVGSPVDLVISLGNPYPSLLLAGQRLVELQNNDGGWDQTNDNDPNNASDPQIFASPAIGLIQAYLHTGEPNMLVGLEKAKAYLLSKTDNFTVTDGVVAVELDDVFGGTDCADHIRSNFYDKLKDGTYYDAFTGTTYNTVDYIKSIRDSRQEQGIPNFAAWELGVGLYSAYLVGAHTSKWVEALKAEIDELDGYYGYDVRGLAGAVLGLAATGEDYDPQTGEHEAASNLRDLADILASYQLVTGGFTWHWIFQILHLDESTLDTAYSIMALSKVDRNAYLTQINDASNYLRNVQLPSGGWENFPGLTDEDAEVTGEAIRAIAMALPLLGDFNNDGIANFSDFSILASAWLTDPNDANWNAACDISDPNDDLIDERDLAVFIENWLVTVR